MKKMIKAEIYYDGEHYCGRCLDFDVFTQGKTLDELVHNLREALQLHFEDDPESLVDFAPNPPLFTMMDLGEIHV
ncbi:MAG: type II toxin-antitoxin system HicB family antitoxin [Thermodesulfobacteriota bacterium]|nr:type II toxin-antitoxin system HicB family antitoxin [Thermodesulfobacteriota bacterium]